jgi:DNA polymerase-1
MGRFRLLPEYEIVKTRAQAEKALKHLSTKKWIGFDTETTGLSRPNDIALVLALSDGDRRWSIWDEQLHVFKDLLEDPDKELIAWNANFDQWMLLNVGIDLNRHAPKDRYRVWDAQVMYALLEDWAPHDLKSTTRKFLGVYMVSFKEAIMSLKSDGALATILLDPEHEKPVGNYASLDAYATYKLFWVLKKQMERTKVSDKYFRQYKTLWDYFEDSELPFTRVLWDMEREGVTIDQDLLMKWAPELSERYLNVQKWFGRATGNLYLNLRSNPKMGDLFFKELGHKPRSYTDGGAPQLDDASLEVWAKQGCQYSEKLQEARDIHKRLNTYVCGLLRQRTDDGKIHTTFNQAGTVTGRLSSDSPNLQNQPPWVREAFIASALHRLLAADYAQLEMRVLAHISGDKTLCQAILNGEDVHSRTAAQMFGVKYDDIIAARERADIPGVELTARELELCGYRKDSKTIGFGLMYGQGARKLGNTLGKTKEDAEKLIEIYFSALTGVTDYFDNAIWLATKEGYCYTMRGRRRGVPKMDSIVWSDRADSERIVRNTPIQGFAAEIVKAAMLKLHENTELWGAGVRMLLQVHDELVFDVPAELEFNERINFLIKNTMMHPFNRDLRVPLEVSYKYGDTWKEIK